MACGPLKMQISVSCSLQLDSTLTAHNKVASQPVWHFTTSASQQKYQLCFWRGDSRVEHSILQRYFICFKNTKVLQSCTRHQTEHLELEQSLTTDLLLPQGWISHHGQRQWLVSVLRTAVTKFIEDNFKHRGSNPISLCTSWCQHKPWDTVLSFWEEWEETFFHRLDKSVNDCTGHETTHRLAHTVLLWLLKPQSGKALKTHKPPNDRRGWQCQQEDSHWFER